MLLSINFFKCVNIHSSHSKKKWCFIWKCLCLQNHIYIYIILEYFACLYCASLQCEWNKKKINRLPLVQFNFHSFLHEPLLWDLKWFHGNHKAVCCMANNTKKKHSISLFYYNLFHLFVCVCVFFNLLSVCEWMANTWYILKNETPSLLPLRWYEVKLIIFPKDIAEKGHRQRSDASRRISVSYIQFFLLVNVCLCVASFVA